MTREIQKKAKPFAVNDFALFISNCTAASPNLDNYHPSPHATSSHCRDTIAEFYESPFRTTPAAYTQALGEITRISESIQNDHFLFGIVIEPIVYKVGTDKTGTTSDQKRFHGFFLGIIMAIKSIIFAMRW